MSLLRAQAIRTTLLLCACCSLAPAARADEDAEVALEAEVAGIERLPLDARARRAVALWRRRLEGRPPRAVWLNVSRRLPDGDAWELIAALVDPPPAPLLDAPTSSAELAACGVAPPQEATLARYARWSRFYRGLDRGLDLDEVLGELAAAGHTAPCLRDAGARARRARGLLDQVQRLFSALDLPVDPGAARRVVVTTWRAQPTMAGEAAERRLQGWVLRDAAPRVTLLDDALQVRRFTLGGAPPRAPAARVEACDVEEELQRWAEDAALSGADVEDSGARSVDAGLASRAWWALARGRAWTAVRLAEALGRRPPGALSRARADLAECKVEAAWIALGAGAPRSEVARGLRAAASASRSAAEGASAPERGLARQALDLAAALEASERRASAAPPTPPWAEWELLAPEERVGHLVRALVDCDGDPTDSLGFGGGGVWRASQRVPADAPAAGAAPDPLPGETPWTHGAPSGRSAADGLLALGEVAVPALIERLADSTPTRCIRNDDGIPVGALSLGECAADVLAAIVDDPERRFGPQAEVSPRTAAEAQRDAREWWAGWAARGGLVAYHRARYAAARRALAAQADPDQRQAWERRRAHHGRWLTARGHDPER